MKSHFFTLFALTCVFATPSVLSSASENATKIEKLERKKIIDRLDTLHHNLKWENGITTEDYGFALRYCNDANEDVCYKARHTFYLAAQQAVYCKESYPIALDCLQESKKKYRYLGRKILCELITTIGDRDINVRNSLLQEMIHYVNYLPEECDRLQLYPALVFGKYILLFAHTAEKSNRVIELSKKAKKLNETADPTQDASLTKDIKDARKYLEDVLVTQMILS